MAEARVKTIEINYGLCGGSDPMDMITITRQQYRDALSFCLAAFHRAGPDDIDEKTNDTLTQLCGGFAAGIESVLFDKDESVLFDKDESDE